MTDNASAPRSRGTPDGRRRRRRRPRRLRRPAAAAFGRRPRRRRQGSRQRRRPRPRRSPTQRPTATPSRRRGTGTGFGLQGSSTGGAGVVGWSIERARLDPADGAFTGIFGWSPAGRLDGQVGVGVVGGSDDWGVFGDGYVGVYGYGTTASSARAPRRRLPASTAYGLGANDLALEVDGKVKLQPLRRGRSVAAEVDQDRSRWRGLDQQPGLRGPPQQSHRSLGPVRRSRPPAASRSTSTARCRRRHTSPGSC